MKIANLFIFLLVLLNFYAIQAMVKGGPKLYSSEIPKGSYQKTCKFCNIRLSDGMLMCSDCDRGNRTFTSPGLANAKHCKGDIANLQGFLVCSKW